MGRIASLLLLTLTLFGCRSENANVASSNQAKPVNQSVATTPPATPANPSAVAPSKEEPPKEIKIDVAAEKKEARAILQALRVIEQQGRSMQSLRNATDLDNARKCGDVMRQRQQAARDLISGIELPSLRINATLAQIS